MLSAPTATCRQAKASLFSWSLIRTSGLCKETCSGARHLAELWSAFWMMVQGTWRMITRVLMWTQHHRSQRVPVQSVNIRECLRSIFNPLLGLSSTGEQMRKACKAQKHVVFHVENISKKALLAVAVIACWARSEDPATTDGSPG